MGEMEREEGGRGDKMGDGERGKKGGEGMGRVKAE